MSSPSQPDDLLAALRAARPEPGYQPSPASPEATALLSRITAHHQDCERARQRRLPRRLVLAGIPAVAGAAAAGAIVAATVRSAAPPRPRSSTAGGLPAASSLRAAILDAFEQASGDILSSVATSVAPDGTTVLTERTWIYPMLPQRGQQVRFRVSTSARYTQTAYESFSSQRPGSTVVLVDGVNRTWFQGRAPTVVVGGLGSYPSQIRADVANGDFRVVGSGEVDGRRALKLQLDSPPPWSAFMWVDATTYAMLRSVSRSTYGSGGKVGSNTVVYQVLPATEANLALLTPVVPAGFARVAKPPFSIGLPARGACPVVASAVDGYPNFHQCEDRHG